jgi:hypothetical protein
MHYEVTQGMLNREGWTPVIKRVWGLYQRGFTLTVPYDFYIMWYAKQVGLGGRKGAEKGVGMSALRK